MPYGRIAPDDVTELLNHWYARSKLYAALMFGDPFLVSDPLSVEVLGDAYRRPLLVLQTVDQVLRNPAALTWAVQPMTRVSGIAGFDAAFNGRPRFYTPLPKPLDYPTGGNVVFPARELYVGIDA